nr:immunoglobulin heavy chain junction region [Macaca mulatta]
CGRDNTIVVIGYW